MLLRPASLQGMRIPGLQTPRQLLEVGELQRLILRLLLVFLRLQRLVSMQHLDQAMLVLLVSVRQRRVLRLRHLDRDHRGMTLFLIVTTIGCLVAPIFG